MMVGGTLAHVSSPRGFKDQSTLLDDGHHHDAGHQGHQSQLIVLLTHPLGSVKNPFAGYSF